MNLLSPTAQATMPLPPKAMLVPQEVHDLVVVLNEHAASAPAPSQALIEHLAMTCVMGHRHLWEDLHLSSRAELNELMARHFPTLKALNVHNMRWKKFLFRLLCERADVLICRSPSCLDCDEQAACFPSEPD